MQLNLIAEISYLVLLVVRNKYSFNKGLQNALDSNSNFHEESLNYTFFYHKNFALCVF